MSELLLTLPVRTWGPNGSHSHWAVTAKRRKTLRMATMAALRTSFGIMPPFIPSVVILTRIGKQKMDSDNAGFAMKGCRDAIADWIGIDDGDSRVDWIVRTATGKAFAVQIEMRAAGIAEVA